jgi:methylamine dehydrogenase accessory protein MauD
MFLNTIGLVAFLALWLLVFFLGFLLLGALRTLGLLRWRLEQLEATTPRRIGRDGLKHGKKAPDFTLPSAAGPEVALHDFAGRKVLLVFTQAGCSPCQAIVPELNRLGGDVQVLVVNNGDAAATRKWADQMKPRFPVLTQDSFSISKRYEVFATPFAFLIDEQGVIRSKGIISNKQHVGFVLGGAGQPDQAEQAEPVAVGAETAMS